LQIPLELVKAGRVAAEIRKMVANLNLIGRSIGEICDIVEGGIRRMGCEPAFPCNVSINEVAAHCTASLDEDEFIKEGDVVKVDLGAHVNGYIADTATTVSYSPEYDTLVHAAEEALNEALKTVREGVSAGDVGRTVSEAAKKWGFKPISNLTGHSMEQYQIHAGVSIPNVWLPGTQRLKAGCIYAIEPFLTLQDGAGSVVDGGAPRIYVLLSRRKTGDRRLDGFAEEIWLTRKTLPFTPRWFLDRYGERELKLLIDGLLRRRVLKGYPVLVERTGRPVAQFEHTIYLTEGGVVVVT